MFEGLLKTKFYSKCKSAIKLTKTRIEIIQRKRNAVQKYLRNDIAELLKYGLDINAHGRAEGLLVELNLSSAYDFVEKYCDCISNYLPMMNKQRECPEECGEAVSSLMFAAARFADLKELRDLRTIFTERYGNSLESYVNQEFVEKLKSMPPTKDMKLKLMQDIGLNYGIEWDSKALEQKLYNPPASKQDWSKNSNDKYKLRDSKDETGWKIDSDSAGYKHGNVRDYVALKMNKEDLSSPGGKELKNDGTKQHNHRENAFHKGDKRVHVPHERLGATPGKDIPVAVMDQNIEENNSNAAEKVCKEGVDDSMPFCRRLIPPPYVKPKVSREETPSEVPPAGSDREQIGLTRLNGHVDGKGSRDRDNLVGETKPKPKSVRRRQLKLPPEHEPPGMVEKMNSNGVKRDGKWALKILDGDGLDARKNEGERVMDRLLIHYSAKKSPYEQGEREAALKPSLPQVAVAANKSMKNNGKDDPLARSASLHVEPASLTEAKKGPLRAISLQPDKVNPVGRAQQLDYDDFVSRLAALRVSKTDNGVRR